MNFIEQIRQEFTNFLVAKYQIDAPHAQTCSLTLNTDQSKQAFGDLTTNAAMVLAKALKQNPRAIAQEITSSFSHPAIEKIEVAGAGFINLYLKPHAWQTVSQELFNQHKDFFKSHPEKVLNYNIEFVSANPTGPLHFGHGRSGIIGDVLSNIVAFVGHKVTKEFYINDAGNQIQKLGQSFKARCEQAVGLPANVPEDGYHGEYLIDLAHQAIATYGKDIITKDQQFFEIYAKDILLERIKNTLKNYGITFDVWFSEKTLHNSQSIHSAIKILQEKGFLYEQEGALWFKSTAFGDDKDRVVKKQTGEWTYIAADIAYLLNKVERGFDSLVYVLGHDHHSYAVRLEGIRQALGLSHITLETILYQLVRIKNEGELVKLSKRAGNIITLDDVIEAVGTDVARFFYLHRKADAHLEFDLELARKKTDENPVYYVQYAYVRIGSILQKASAEDMFANITIADAHAIGAEEVPLLKKIVSLKPLLHEISQNYQTHMLTYYVMELADLYHSYYAKNRIIDLSNQAQSRSRLLLMQVIRQTMGTCLDLLGISKPEKM